MANAKSEEISSSPVMEFEVRQIYGTYYYYPKNKLAEKAREVFNNRKNDRKSKTFSRKQLLFFKECGVIIKIIANQEIK